MTAFILKIIALISMLISHAEMTNLLNQPRLMNWFGLSIPESAQVIAWLGAITRFAFPIFAFFIAEGCRHTRNRKKYLLRLLFFGLISELPFDLMSAWIIPSTPFAFYSPFTHLNVFFTHALGVTGVMIADHLKEKNSKISLIILALLPILLIAELLQTDYLLPGVLLIWAAYFPKKRISQLSSMAVVLAFLYLLHNYRYSFPIDLTQWRAFFASCVSLILIALYNGKQGRRCKWFFYIAYPMHMSLFVAISFLVK